MIIQKLKRKPNRLNHFDYTTPGYYFVTICAQDRVCCFGEVIDGEMVLNKFGKIVEKYWVEIPEHYPNVKLDVYQIMPNHLHGIIIITPVGAAIGRPTEKAGNARPYISLNTIIGSFKNITVKIIHKSGSANFSWQKSFYDHVIRRDESLEKIRTYITNNPKQWELDLENPKNLKQQPAYNLAPKPPSF